ncbi:MAG: rhodanese-like domain-containing protein [Candidatus Zhuqueibacterota bacterium]
MYKKIPVLFLILSLALFMVVGCDDDETTEPEEINEFELLTEVGDVYVANYTTQGGLGVNTTITAVFDNLTDGNTANDPYIIDYRSAADYAIVHIKGAHSMAMTDLVAKLDDGTIPKDKTILNVCYTGQTASSATAFLNLLGYEAQNLSYGMCSVDTSFSNTKQWKNAVKTDEHAGDVVSTASTTTTTHDFPTLSTGGTTAEEIFKARFNEVIAASWPKIDANLVWDNPGNYFIVNYWPAAEYTNPGHIPGAYQFSPNTTLLSTAQLNLLPTDKTIVVYCYTGQTSAQICTYLTMLGYDAKSLLYGFNGFAHGIMTKNKYAGSAAPGTYDAILEK